MERFNANKRSEKIKGRKMCAICGIFPRQNEQISVGHSNAPDVLCGESCLDSYMEDAQEGGAVERDKAYGYLNKTL